ncbi:YjgP/YjgQ family permease, partial [bacterium]|nr:YjgP/YjgQ family permease [bacterium]
MTKLDKYFLKELIKTFLVGLVVAELVLLGLQGIRLSGLIVSQGLDWSLILRLVAGLCVSFLPVVLPVSFLFSLLIVFGRMSSDRELLALQSMGYEPARLLKPGLFLGVLVAMASIWVSFDLGPKGNRNFEIAIDTIYRKKVTNVLRSGTFAEGFLGMVVFVDEVDPFTQELKRVFLYDESSFTKNTSISASHGRWEGSDSGLGSLRLFDGLILVQDHDSNRIQRIRFDEYKLFVDYSVDMAGGRNSPASQGWQALIEKREELKTSGADPRGNWVEIARRFAVGLACLLFVPLSFLLALDNRRTAKNRAVAIGLVVVIGYWTAYFAMATWYQRASIASFSKYEIMAW